MPGRVPPEQHLREFTRSCVRSGLLTEQQLYDEVVLAIRAELPAVTKATEAEALARAWIGEFRDELAADERTWPEVTDYDRVQAVFAELGDSGIVVLQGCEDHWAAKAALQARAADGSPPLGIAWFTPSDVWHAIDEGMLEVNLWHADTSNVAPGDALLDEVVAVFGRHGVPAHFDEGRIEVGAHWQRRLVTPGGSAPA